MEELGEKWEDEWTRTRTYGRTMKSDFHHPIQKWGEVK